ncbi:TPA: hypothetical protein HA338_10550 [Methanosarcina acetivorans]|uniref:RNase H type-2 domain-containing protein n=1 Tax=Methanosarcina acetivorans TaxID=2214 RepID=A0A832SJR7_9EURY|nr:hypothetical protein [Methanosarcina acetivorans]
MHKADATSPMVSAASITAKVRGMS